MITSVLISLVAAWLAVASFLNSSEAFKDGLFAVASCFLLNSQEGNPETNKKHFLGTIDVQDFKIEPSCPSGIHFNIPIYSFIIELNLQPGL